MILAVCPNAHKIFENKIYMDTNFIWEIKFIAK